MITKFLCVGKQLLLTSQEGDYEKESVVVIPLKMPVDVYWTIEKLVQDADYMINSGGMPSQIKSLYDQVFRIAIPFTMAEKDRLWIQEKLTKKENPLNQ